MATVEFAIAAPFLLLLLLAFAEFGREYNQYVTLTKLVRDGARYAAANAAPDTLQVIQLTPELVSTVRNLVVTGQPTGGSPLLQGLSLNDVQVTQQGSDFVNVTATFGYLPLFASIPLFYGGGTLDMAKTMTVSSTMRAL